MATDKNGEVQGSSSSGKAGGGKNISALLKKLKGKINSKSQGTLQTTANKGGSPTGPAVSVPGIVSPTTNPDTPFVGVDAQKYLVDSQLKGFGFGKVVTDFSTPSIGFGGQPPAFGGVQGGTPPMTPLSSPVGGVGTPPMSPLSNPLGGVGTPPMNPLSAPVGGVDTPTVTLPNAVGLQPPGTGGDEDK